MFGYSMKRKERGTRNTHPESYRQRMDRTASFLSLRFRQKHTIGQAEVEPFQATLEFVNSLHALPLLADQSERDIARRQAADAEQGQAQTQHHNDISKSEPAFAATANAS